MLIVVLIICFMASVIGALVGAGGGVIIKPVLDMVGVMPAKTISFCSGCTVLMMAIVSVIRSRNSGVVLKKKVVIPLGIGAALGGVAGTLILNALGGSNGTLGAVQNICMVTLTGMVFIYICNKNKIRSFDVGNFLIILVIGTVMGGISSFLGIGGGPINMAVLFFFFSLQAKQAALNSLCLIVFSQAASLILSCVTGSVPQFDPLYLVCMIVGGISGALMGSVIMKRISNSNTEFLLKCMILVIIGISCYNVFSYVNV